MDIMASIYERARQNPKKVAFSEACEEKILLAARRCQDEGIALSCLVGPEPKIREAAQKYGVGLEGVELFDTDGEYVSGMVEAYIASHPKITQKGLDVRCKTDPMYAALILQANGLVDVTFSGLIHTTGDVIRGGLNIIGCAPGINTVSSMGIFEIPGYEGPEGPFIGFGDSAVCISPTPEQLASIAISACDTAAKLVGWDPRCALLSFSSDGSAEHEMVNRVREARDIAQKLRPDLKIDGEFQLDSAVDPAVAAKKVRRESPVAGKANIVIWPDINAGNIGVKLVQQFARADAYGPMLQGFAKVVCDCSRGAPVSEIVGNVAMSVVRAQ